MNETHQPIELGPLAAAELWSNDEPFYKRQTIFGSWPTPTRPPDFDKAGRFALHFWDMILEPR